MPNGGEFRIETALVELQDDAERCREGGWTGDCDRQSSSFHAEPVCGARG
jgi:hypothetical protein